MKLIKISKIILLTILIIIALLGLTILITNIAFNQTNVRTLYNDKFKIWGHAGYQKKYQKNSIPALSHAFDLGARLAEMVDFRTATGSVTLNFARQEKEGQ